MLAKRNIVFTFILSMVLLLSGCSQKSESTTANNEKKEAVEAVAAMVDAVEETAEDTSNSGEEESNTKGSRKNPYTMEDTFTLTDCSWEGNRLLGGTFVGTNKFEISNMHIEDGEVNGFDVKLLVFDRKCLETFNEDGIHRHDNGNPIVSTFFNPNMQTIDFFDISEQYTGQPQLQLVYFEGTTYTEAYAMCDNDNGTLKPSDETYSMMRFCIYDENLDPHYVYVKLD